MSGHARVGQVVKVLGEGYSLQVQDHIETRIRTRTSRIVLYTHILFGLCSPLSILKRMKKIW